MKYYLLMNKKGFFKPFNLDRSFQGLVRFETGHQTKEWKEIVKFYNYNHPESWFFYSAFPYNKYFKSFLQCRNCKQ